MPGPVDKDLLDNAYATRELRGLAFDGCRSASW